MNNVVEFEEMKKGDIVTLISKEAVFSVDGVVHSVGFNPAEWGHQITMMYNDKKKIVFSDRDYWVTVHHRPLKSPTEGKYLTFRHKGTRDWIVGIWDGKQFVGVNRAGVVVTAIPSSSYDAFEWEYLDEGE